MKTADSRQRAVNGFQSSRQQPLYGGETVSPYSGNQRSMPARMSRYITHARWRQIKSSPEELDANADIQAAF